MPSSHYDQAAEQARTIERANTSPRALRLDRLERYVLGEQYEGRASFWDDSVPLYERAPHIQYPIAERAIRSNVDLVLGEGRFPEITSCAGEDDSIFDERFGLDENDSAALDKFIRAAEHQSRFEPRCDEALEQAQACGTVAAIGAAKNGRLSIEIVKAKWAVPEFDENDPDVVVSLEIRYPYVEEYTDDKGRRVPRCLLYRRVVDTQRDVVYKPAIASEEGREPDHWVEDSERTTEHKLGFCPVVWYRFRKKCSHVADIDGRALHAQVLGEIDGLNFGISQIHRSALMAGDPQIVECGVEEGHNPAPLVPKPRGIWLPGDPMANRQWLTPSMGNRGGANLGRSRGPGVAWTYPDKDTKVNLLTLPSGALDAQDKTSNKILAMIKEALAVVLLDPENTKIGSDVSGRTLQWLHQKQIDACNKIRVDFGNGFILPMINILLRIALACARGGRGALYIGGLAAAATILARFEQPITSGGTAWFAPELTLKWGAYFAPTSQDQKTEQDMAIAAHDANAITRRTLVEKIAPSYNIKNVDQYLEALEKEDAKRVGSLHAAQAALTSAGVGDESEERAEPQAVPPLQDQEIADA